MNILLILYLVYLSWGTVGQGRVSILELSRYLRISKTEARNRAFKLAQLGHLEIVETFSDRGSKKLYVQLAPQGDDFLMRNFDAAVDTYHQHVAETILIVRQRTRELNYEPRKMSKKEIDQIAAGQKRMFE
jgi:hypothetical protein